MAKVIYLASPYTGNEQANFEAVCRTAGHLMKASFFVFSPIAHTHPIAMGGTLPTDWNYWEAYDRAMIERCDAVWVLMLDGWEESKGVTAEIEYAKYLGKDIKFITKTWEDKL